MGNFPDPSPAIGWLRDVVVASVFVAATGATQQAFSQIDTVTVQGREYRETVKLQGASVHGFQVTEVKAKLGGFVKLIEVGPVDKLEVDVGSRVQKGQVLAVLEIPEMQNDLAQKDAIVEQTISTVKQADAAITEAEALVAQSQAAREQVEAGVAKKKALLKLGEAKLRRLSDLAAAGTIGRDNLDEAKYDVEVAQAALHSVEADIKAANANIQAAQAAVKRATADKVSAEAHVKVAKSAVDRLKVMMGYTVIKAPYDGVITKRMVDAGSFVQPAQDNSAAMPVFELTQISRIRIMVAVPNNKVALIQPGQPVVFASIGGLEGHAFGGTVTRTAGALDLRTRTMQIEVHLDNPALDIVSNKQVELKPGLFGTLTVIRKDWKGDTPLPVVPTTSIGKDDDGNHFVVVVQNGRPTRRQVRIAFDDAAFVGISRGLKVGEKVVRSGANKY